MSPSIGQTSIDDEECYVQEWDTRPDAGSVVRGRIRLNKLVRLFFVPWTENEELIGAVSRSLPLKSDSPEVTGFFVSPRYSEG